MRTKWVEEMCTFHWRILSICPLIHSFICLSIYNPSITIYLSDYRKYINSSIYSVIRLSIQPSISLFIYADSPTLQGVQVKCRDCWPPWRGEERRQEEKRGLGRVEGGWCRMGGLRWRQPFITSRREGACMYSACDPLFLPIHCLLLQLLNGRWAREEAEATRARRSTNTFPFPFTRSSARSKRPRTELCAGVFVQMRGLLRGRMRDVPSAHLWPCGSARFLARRR